jgi:hypothetical protein
VALERDLLGAQNTETCSVVFGWVLQIKKVVAEGLSSLVNICQAVHFRGFEEAKING